MSTGEDEYECPVAPSAKRGRPKVLSDSARRKAILHAAQQAFSEYGFARTTTQIVATRAKVSKRSIYELFPDKMALFADVIRDHGVLFLDLPRPANEDIPIFEALVTIFRLDIDEAEEHRRQALLNLINRESQLFPELSDYLYDNGIIRAREDLIDWLVLQNETGKLRVDDPLMCAEMLMDIVFGTLFPRRRWKHPPDRELRRRHTKCRLEIFLRGVSR